MGKTEVNSHEASGQEIFLLETQILAKKEVEEFGMKLRLFTKEWSSKNTGEIF